MDQLFGLFNSGAQQFMEASLFFGWLTCVIFGMLSVFSIMYYHMKGKGVINGKKAIKTDLFNAYGSLVGSIAFPMVFIYHAYSLYLIYTNPTLKLFEHIF